MIAKDRRSKEWSNDEGRRRKLEQREREGGTTCDVSHASGSRFANDKNGVCMCVVTVKI